MWAPVTGYASQAFGATQLESIEDGILTGNDDRLFFRRTLDMITGKKQEGGNVVTTLNAAAQKAAFEGLLEQEGRRRRDRPGDRRDPGPGLHAVVRPVDVRRELHQGRRQGLEQAPEEEQPRRPDAQPGAARDLPARLDLQGRHGRRGAGERPRTTDADAKTDSPLPVHPAGHHGPS